MLNVDTAEANSTVVINGYAYETPRSPWRLRGVDVLDNYALRVTFRDGLSGIVRMHERVRRPNAGVFNSLADPELFADVSVVFGVVTWGNGVDLAPDAMHDEIERNGEWVLR
jgi:hypothetical protein